MTKEQAVDILSRLKNWKSGADKRVIIEAGIKKEMIIEALELAISHINTNNKKP